MRIFSIKEDRKFGEFSQAHFHVDREESVLENWLENNSDDILEDGKLLIISRQVTTNLGSIIDLLGIDREGNTVVIELKRDRTARDTLVARITPCLENGKTAFVNFLGDGKVGWGGSSGGASDERRFGETSSAVYPPERIRLFPDGGVFRDHLYTRPGMPVWDHR